MKVYGLLAPGIGAGRNLKKLMIDLSKISGFPLSRLALARKSAQIIARHYLAICRYPT